MSQTADDITVLTTPEVRLAQVIDLTEPVVEAVKSEARSLGARSWTAFLVSVDAAMDALRLVSAVVLGAYALGGIAYAISSKLQVDPVPVTWAAAIIGGALAANAIRPYLFKRD